jgi:RNA-directed DNA polymerase
MPPEHDGNLGRSGKADGRTPEMHDMEKSDESVVLTKSPNEGRRTAARQAEEVVEGRDSTKGNTGEQNVPRTQGRTSTHSALERVRQAAKKDKEMKFTALFHHVTIDRLRGAYKSLKKDAAPGVDGVTWWQYGKRLEDNLRDLHDRLHRGAYRAKPTRRVYIPKPDGQQRPLGIACMEDKIVQGAVAEVLLAIYEEDFIGFSYGFRRGRSQHHALDALAVGLTRKRVNWVLDADIRGFFDAIDHAWLIKFMEHRIADKRILRLIHKWLGAGVLEQGAMTKSKVGVPQGATISPLLANIYLHYVLDLWAHQWRKRHAKGDLVIVRYADDFVMGFQDEADARRFQFELRERLCKFGLELHEDKTRLLRFGRFAAEQRRRLGEGKPETFEFLGFTHICGRSSRGRFLLIRHSSAKRMRSKLAQIKRELRARMHDSTVSQGAWLRQVMNGWFAYHSIPANKRKLDAFKTAATKLWRQALRRRSQTNPDLWAKIDRLEKRWLPRPTIRHPWPWDRFDAMTRGRSRVR